MPPRNNDSIESPLQNHKTSKSSHSTMDSIKKKTKKERKSSTSENATSRYLTSFAPLKSQYRFITSLFKNEEQISSSLAALDAAIMGIRSIEGSSSSSDGTLCLVLGDGKTPRTAMVAAIRHGWNVVSIDSKLDCKWEDFQELPEGKFIGYRGSMSSFLSEGCELVDSLCDIDDIRQLVILAMEQGEECVQLKSLRGRLGISDLRVLYNNVCATIVCISSQESRDGDCGLKANPIHSFVDEDILGSNRLVRVWNLQGSRRTSDASSQSALLSAGKKKSSSKVAQLQRQQDLARQNRIKSSKKMSSATDEASDTSSYYEKPKSKSKKNKHKSKSKRNSSTDLVPVHKEPAVTVSSFLQQQKSLQSEVETYRTHTSRSMLLTNGDYGDSHSPVSSQTIDTVPSDHPSSSIIQTHRTCTVCHRTLMRSQFSERDRYLVSLSLGPGAVCRTCTMTVAATKLKMMPSHEQLLADYATRGEFLMANGQLPALGYSPVNKAAAANESALVLHSGNPSNDGSVTGNELVPFQPSDDQNAIIPSIPPTFTGVDVNAPFSGILPEEERPTHIADCKYIDAVLSMPCYPKLNSMELFASSKDVSVSMAALDAVKLYGTLDEEYFVAHDGEGERVVTRSMRKKMGGIESPTNINPKSVICLVIGEGSQPRTAVLASLHYGWTTLSIDPALSEDWDGYQDDVPNYTGYSGTISEFMSDEYTESYFELDNAQSRPRHLVIVGVQMTKDEMRLKGQSNINEIRARYDDIPTTLVSMSPLRKATLAPKRRDGQCGSKLEKDVGYEPNCSYIDEGVFSVCRLVEVWNFHNEDQGSEDEEDLSRDEEGEDEDYYSKESIEDDRADLPYRDAQYEKRFSMERDPEFSKKFSLEQLSVEDINDSMYRRFQDHVSRAGKDHESRIEKNRALSSHDEQEEEDYSRQESHDSMLSGSTLSTKGKMPVNATGKRRKSKRRDKPPKIPENSVALALPINSMLEKENARRKSKCKMEKDLRKRPSGPRPIPDDIPEDLEISAENFVGEGPPRPEGQQLVEWNNEQTYDEDYHQGEGNDAIAERLDSYTDKGSYRSGSTKSFMALEVHDHENRSYQSDDQGQTNSGRSEEFDSHGHKPDYYERDAEEHGRDDNHSYHSHSDEDPGARYDDYYSHSSEDEYKEEERHSNDNDSYSDKSGDYCGKEERIDNYSHDEYDQVENYSYQSDNQGLNPFGRSEEIDAHGRKPDDYERNEDNSADWDRQYEQQSYDEDVQNENHSYHSDEQGLDHSGRSEEFDSLRRKPDYYECEEDNSAPPSPYMFDDDADSGIAALNDYNASCGKLDHELSAHEEEDDAFPDYWSEDEDMKPPAPASSTPQRKQPWHKKETYENSFQSYGSYGAYSNSFHSGED